MYILVMLPINMTKVHLSNIFLISPLFIREKSIVQIKVYRVFLECILQELSVNTAQGNTGNETIQYNTRDFACTCATSHNKHTVQCIWNFSMTLSSVQVMWLSHDTLIQYKSHDTHSVQVMWLTYDTLRAQVMWLSHDIVCTSWTRSFSTSHVTVTWHSEHKSCDCHMIYIHMYIMDTSSPLPLQTNQSDDSSLYQLSILHSQPKPDNYWSYNMT